MVRKGQSKGGDLFGGPAPVAAAPAPLTEKDEALLLELLRLALEERRGALAEDTLRKRQKDLYFRLRARFSTLAAALAEALKLELGGVLTRKDVLDDLRARYETGAPVTLEGVVGQSPRLASALVKEFGGMDAAWRELGIRPDLALKDRRMSDDALFGQVLELAGTVTGFATEEELAGASAFLREAVRWRFGSYNLFRKVLAEWLSGQPLLYLVWGRNVISRLLLAEVPLTGRGGKGRTLSDVSRMRSAWECTGCPRPALLWSDGCLVPLEVAEVPFVSFSSSSVNGGQKMSSSRKSGRPLCLVSLDDREGVLAMVTRGGLLKLMPLANARRVRKDGLPVIRLAEGDEVCAAAVLGPSVKRVVLVTRQGRGVAFVREGWKLASRISMGHIRLRESPEGLEPLEVVGLAEGEDLVLLGRNGFVLRLRGEEVPVRKGASRGRLLWRTPVVAAAACTDESRLLIGTRKGRLLSCSGTEVAGRSAQCKGVYGVRLDGDDLPEVLRRLK
ncbi:MAG: hypothetical protein FJ109_03450 [Deltaproteobacteria bacterium]|nr:hypothetical protein [Deltaproteobacteria bacterium]